MNQAVSSRPASSPDVDLLGSWHILEVTAAAKQLDVDPSSGLTPQAAQSRLALAGLNRLTGPPPRSPWLLFLSQFKSVLILVLFAAAALAALVGNLKDAGVILAVVVINAIVGFYQEYRAEKSLAALRKMLPLRTHVRRGGKKFEIDAETRW